ncbi:MAG: insulinase family protein, partial [Acetatifactor sp.]|nr:insulinase family protein [Acetatifactor sp.]
EEREQQLREHLKKVKAGFADEELERVKETFKELREFQETEDAKEDLEKIPLLERSDLKKEAPEFVIEERKIDNTRFLYHNLFTNGIGYLRLIFTLNDIPKEYFPYIGILRGCLGLLDTEHYRYGDLYNEINLVTGGMVPVNNVYPNANDPDRFVVTLELKTKVFYENIQKAVDLMKEIIFTSNFADTKRLLEILAEGKSRMQAQMLSGGHMVAASRAIAYGSVSATVSEEISGVPFYRLVADIEEHFDERKNDLIDKLTTLAKMIFRKENLLIDFVGEEKALDGLTKAVSSLESGLYTNPVKKEEYRPRIAKTNEGFMTSSQIQYVCRAGNFRRNGLEYKGSLKVLKVMLGYEYLWVNVRVKGGAYGCMCSFSKNGESYFVSYRDPHLKNTLQIFDDAADAIANYKADERTITQYIIGAISDLDIPLTPPMKGLRALSAYMTGLTSQMVQRERDEILGTTAEDIRSLSEYIKAFMADDFLCVVGNANKIKENKECFGKIENLFA